MAREDPLQVLLAPVIRVPGCDAETAELLEKLRIRSVWDLLRHYPRRYQDRSVVTPIAEAASHKEATVQGTVQSVRRLKLRFKRRYRTEVDITDETGQLTAVYFARPTFYRKQFKKGQRVIFFGRTGSYRGRPQLHQPEFEILEGELTREKQGLVPIYPATEGIDQFQFRRLLESALTLATPHLPRTLPESLENERGLVSLAEAFRTIHQPATAEEITAGNERLDYEELFHMQLGLVTRRRLVKVDQKPRATTCPEAVHKRIRELIPHTLTGAQERVIGEILEDFSGTAPMNRLLQGDVGSGKTLVAAYAMLVKVADRQQVALMAPTEILAEQHFRTLKSLLPSAKFEIALLTGRTPAAEKKRIRAGLADGSLPMIVGTHALVSSGTKFDTLGLVVVDEQHKFGVLQRADLQRKGHHPDVLVMTATPIPRTLSLTLYGDLDVSVIDEMPPGRQAVVTKKIHPNHRVRMEQAVRREIKKGRQAFYIYPLVEESEKVDLQAATGGLIDLDEAVYPDLRCALLHGKMKGDEKEAVMTRFRNGDVDILVSTIVVEVGVDVPNATVMVIEHAERFGLAQLHQLRGRIGRGAHKSTCYLVADPKTEEGQKRIATMCRSQDGFTIAEVDLELRGAGDHFGTRQSGQPGSRIGRVLHNLPLISQARNDAEALLEADPKLEHPENAGCHLGYRLQFAYTLNLTSIA